MKISPSLLPTARTVPPALKLLLSNLYAALTRSWNGMGSSLEHGGGDVSVLGWGVSEMGFQRVGERGVGERSVNIDISIHGKDLQDTNYYYSCCIGTMSNPYLTDLGPVMGQKHTSPSLDDVVK